MAKEQIYIDLIPGKLPPTCHASQYDIGRTIQVNLTEGGAPYTLDGTETITVEVRKPDGNFVTASCTATLGNTYVDVVTTEQMTACAGMNLCDLKIEKGGNTIGTLNFIMSVEQDPIEGASASDTVIYNITQLVNTALAGSAYVKEVERLGNVIGNINIVPFSEVLSNYYVSATGDLTASTSWDTYKFKADEIAINKVVAWSNNATFYAVAFYSNDTFTSANLIDGVKFPSSSEASAQTIENIEIPAGAAYVLVTNRKGTGTLQTLDGSFICAPNIRDLNAEMVDAKAGIDYVLDKKVIDGMIVDYFYGNYYINGSGVPTSSNSWEMYLIPVADFYSAAVKVYSYQLNYYEVAFYSGAPSSGTFISGKTLTPAGTLTNVTIAPSDIPGTAVYMAISNRKAYGTGAEIKLTTTIKNQISELESSMLSAMKEISALGGRGNVRAIYKNITNTNDFTVIKDEIWFFQNIYNQGVPTDDTNIFRYKIGEDDTLKFVSQMVADFGHCNTIDYCEENDCLIFGNGSNSTSTVGNWFAVIPHPLDLPASATIQDYGIKYDVNIGYKVQAMWGENNFGEYNIAYLLSNDATTITRVLLEKDLNGDFNGNMITLETITSSTSIIVGGGDFWGDNIYIGNGSKYGIDKFKLSDSTVEEIEKKFYKADGTEYSGSTQGVHVDSKYIWVFSNVAGEQDNYLIQYCR